MNNEKEIEQSKYENHLHPCMDDMMRSIDRINLINKLYKHFDISYARLRESTRI